VPGAERKPAKAPSPFDERRKELADLRRRLAELKARYAATKKKEEDLREAVKAADLNLEIRTAERRMLEIQTADAKKAAESAAAERDSSVHEVAALRSDLAVRISALYRMGKLGYLRTLVVAESGRTFLRGLQVLTHLARKDADLLSRYETSLATLETRERELAIREKELSALAGESRQKELDLEKARGEKAALLARVARASESERVAVEKLEDRSTRLAALLDLLETHGRALPAGAASIRSYKGVLDWPVKGKVVVPYGRIANPKFPKTFLRSSGWTLEAEPGTDVKAVFAGDVAYAQWMKGYGNLVVLDHGDGVFTLYGRLANGTVARGTRVGVGDSVGRLGPPPEDEVPGLYFEVRDSRSSVDPKGWLK
jgi:septal ring factor EnvC (AmiA/AmiB activator)